MAYTTINKPSLHFNTKTYTGNGGTQSITGVGFQPDFCWNKNRSVATSHQLFDAVRGATKRIYSDSTASEDTNTNSLTSFDSDGFSVGSGSSANGNGNNIVSWNWKANGQGSSNTDGSINTTYTSVNTTAGFSMSKYVGNDTAGATVGHGLGAVPKMIIVKRISGSAQDWIVYHGANTSAPETDYLQLNGTAATGDSSGVWNDTAPTSSVFSLGSASSVNGGGGSDSFIAYCFAEKTGYSKFGSYVGNGNTDGAFIYIGFKPAFFLLKRTDGAGDKWRLWDNERSPFNVVDDSLAPNESSAEYDDVSVSLDFLSNGCKMRMSGGGAGNGSGETYIYMAFAEAPLVGTNNVPCTAR